MAKEMISENPPIIWETGDTITAQKLNYVEQRINNLLNNNYFLLKQQDENDESKYELDGRSEEELMKINPDNVILGIPDQFNNQVKYVAYYIGEQPDRSAVGSPVRPTWAYLSYTISQEFYMQIKILTYEGNGIFTSLGQKEF